MKNEVEMRKKRDETHVMKLELQIDFYLHNLSPWGIILWTLMNGKKKQEKVKKCSTRVSVLMVTKKRVKSCARKRKSKFNIYVPSFLNKRRTSVIMIYLWGQFYFWNILHFFPAFLLAEKLMICCWILMELEWLICKR